MATQQIYCLLILGILLLFVVLMTFLLGKYYCKPYLEYKSKIKLEKMRNTFQKEIIDKNNSALESENKLKIEYEKQKTINEIVLKIADSKIE